MPNIVCTYKYYAKLKMLKSFFDSKNAKYYKIHWKNMYRLVRPRTVYKSVLSVVQKRIYIF